MPAGASLLAALSASKLKLLDSALGNLAETAKNAGPLNDLFSTMKEGSMMTAPWETLLNILRAETTAASADSIKDLFILLKDPVTQAGIEALSAGMGSVMEVVAGVTAGFVELLRVIQAMEDKLKFPEDPFAAIIEFFTGRRLSTAVEAELERLKSISTTAWMADVYGGGTSDPDIQSGSGGYQE